MMKNTFRVMRNLALASACMTLPLASSVLAQTPKQNDAEISRSPTIVFEDGVLMLSRTDGEKILLERRNDRALMKFESDPEVWALTITPGPGNTELFKNDAERLFLRLTERGNLSLYTTDYPGEPLDVSMAEAGFEAPAPETDDFAERLSDYLTIRVGHKITVHIDSPTEDDLVWMQEAATIVVKGIIKSEDHVDHITEVRILPGNVPDFKLNRQGVFTAYVNPDKEYEGRSSSDRVILFLKNRFNN